MEDLLGAVEKQNGIMDLVDPVDLVGAVDPVDLGL